MFIVCKDDGNYYNKILCTPMTEREAQRYIIKRALPYGQPMFYFDGSAVVPFRIYNNDIPQPYEKFVRFYTSFCAKIPTRRILKEQQKHFNQS
jgi:hypothetical protein